MAYRLDEDRAVLANVRRIAEEQSAAALDGLRSIDDVGVVSAVHDARKRCKKVRGLVRLVRPALGDQYQDANRTFRDAARALSDYRDAHALLGTFDRMVAASVGRLPAAGLGPVRLELERRRDRSTDDVDRRDDCIDRAVTLLAAGRERIGDWTLDDDGWPAVAGGLAKTYGRGRRALTRAIAEPTPQRHHELRKRAKYTWYHVRLLTPSAPSSLRPLAERWHDLTDALGDAHDLAVLHDHLKASPDEFGGDEQVAAAMSVLDGHRTMLERRSVDSAGWLYAESPKRFAARLGGYWSCWQQHGDEPDLGGLDDIVSGLDDGLDDLTVTTLREVARRADVPGRSTRNRAELIASLRAAGVGASG